MAALIDATNFPPFPPHSFYSLYSIKRELRFNFFRHLKPEIPLLTNIELIDYGLDYERMEAHSSRRDIRLLANWIRAY